MCVDCRNFCWVGICVNRFLIIMCVFGGKVVGFLWIIMLLLMICD